MIENSNLSHSAGLPKSCADFVVVVVVVSGSSCDSQQTDMESMKNRTDMPDPATPDLFKISLIFEAK